MKTLTLVLLLILAGPAKAGHYVLGDVLHAQDFSTVQLKGMPTVYVEDRSGREVEGKLVSLTESALTIDIDGVGRTFAPAEVTKIDRRGDSLKNGALIGAAVGLFTGLLGDCPRAGTNNDSKGCPGARVGYVLGGSAIWAGIGAGIDALIPGRTRLWPAPTK
jgi:hypothetical protein